MDHILLRCGRAQYLWDFFHHGSDALISDNFNDFLRQRSSSYTASTIAMTIARHIWKQMNNLIFNNSVEDPASAAR
jgi:hypothetical protein